VRPTVTSPCVRVCKLDGEGVCLGCFRTLDEISQWPLMDDEERLIVVACSRQRRDQARLAEPAARVIHIVDGTTAGLG